MYDHLWGDRDISSQEQRRRKALAYQEELKRQMDEKQSMNKNSGNDYYGSRRASNHPLRNSYDSTMQRNILDNYVRGSTIPKANQSHQTFRSDAGSTIGTYTSGGLSSVAPVSTFSGFSNSGGINSQFSETLRAQIDAASRAGSSIEVSIPPLSTVTPSVPSTFSSATRFDEAKFEFTPNITRSYRSVGAGSNSRISPISMRATSSVRSQFNSSFDTIPQVDTTALRPSKVGTPQTGFSMRSSSSMASTWGGNNFATTF